ncbi:hypothetical protein [Streptomyces sp. NPDC048361]|uniref:hypothetical protein n=1 Tax=Streptomyces sp. NPDC048361 TaxID=3154720 RepID=UPI00343E9FAD
MTDHGPWSPMTDHGPWSPMTDHGPWSPMTDHGPPVADEGRLSRSPVVGDDHNRPMIDQREPSHRAPGV